MTSNTSNQSNSREGSDLDRYSFGLRLALLAASSLTVMAGATMSPSLPAMQSHFHDVPDVAYWVKLLLTLPALFIALFAPVAGWVAARQRSLHRLLVWHCDLDAVERCKPIIGILKIRRCRGRFL